MDERNEFEQNAAGFTPEEGAPIRIEEDEVQDDGQAASKANTWTEEFTVAGEELVDNVRRLLREVGVRRIVVKNEQKRILLEIPMVVGVAGIALLPFYASLALIAAIVADCTISVERVAAS
jgi:hypothetical protein